MDYKEKYEQALERARQYNRDLFAECNGNLVEYIFPELKDERTREEIMDFISKVRMGQETFRRDFYDWEEWIAWLEKQGQVKESQISKHENKTCKENNISLTREQKPAWSEEDEDKLNSCIDAINAVYKWDVMINWLKSLKDRVQPHNRWKPSDVQMECLSDAIKHYNSWGYDAPILKELLNDLKKLGE